MLLSRILDVLNEVEIEVIQQTAIKNTKAKEVANASVERISLILLAFFIVTAFFIFFILTDLSKSNKYKLQLMKSKEEAESHSLARQRFLSNMSHEIRTPLQSILGYAEQVKEQEKPDKNDIEAIYSSSEHLLQIVNEVLDYSRISSGKFHFENKSFSLIHLLEETIEALQPQANKKALLLELKHDLPQDTFLEGDPFRLKQILINLLGNSLKFTNNGKVSLDVHCKQEGSKYFLQFKIQDTGIGIAKEKIKTIFNQFEQADASISEAYGGTGLGLSIVKALIEQQQGKISVISEPGKGSLFTVELGFKKSPQTALPEQSRIPKGSLNYKETVWLVDDDALILKLCSDILRKKEITHRCFNSAEALLKEEWDDSVKIVLTDIRMKEMSGIKLCHELRKRLGSDLQIIALTAQALPEEREEILKQGFNKVLKKPFRENELLGLFTIDLQESVPVSIAHSEIEKSLETIEKLTFGDKELMQTIIKQFVEDSKNDVTELLAVTSKNETEKASLLLHRIAGRTSQIGNISLGLKFRKAEITLQKEGLSSELIKEIELLGNQMEIFIVKF
jgi:signal transduction histidine kinase/FixJ family two-component response regulator